MHHQAKDLQDRMVQTRRDLHRIPELGLELPQTAAYVRARLEELGIPYRMNAGDTGIIAEIRGGAPGKTVALRADMDALPMEEQTGLPFAAQNGCMHACGHDAHTAMLLGAAQVLQDNAKDLRGNVRLIFQTAEEVMLGAKVALENGAMEGVDGVFGLHTGTLFGKEIPSGTALVTGGSFMAASDKFTIRVKGQGCHGSTPEKGVDPVNISAHIVIALQAIAAREYNACVPVVVTVGSIHGGSQYNIIPDEVTLVGTIRTLDETVRRSVGRRIVEIAEDTARVFGGRAEAEILWCVPPVVNDPAMAALAAEAAKEALGPDHVLTSLAAPNMGSEDFAYYLEQAPGAFLFLSASAPEKGMDLPHHNPRFTVDEDALWAGAAVLVAIAQRFLNS